MAVKGHKGEREERRYRSTVGSCFLGNDYLGKTKLNQLIKIMHEKFAFYQRV